MKVDRYSIWRGPGSAPLWATVALVAVLLAFAAGIAFHNMRHPCVRTVRVYGPRPIPMGKAIIWVTDWHDECAERKP